MMISHICEGNQVVQRPLPGQPLPIAARHVLHRRKSSAAAAARAPWLWLEVRRRHAVKLAGGLEGGRCAILSCFLFSQSAATNTRLSKRSLK